MGWWWFTNKNKDSEDFVILKNKLKNIKDINIVFKICKLLAEECEIIYNRTNKILRYVGLSNSLLVFLVTTGSVLTDVYKESEEKEKLKTFHVIYVVLLYLSSIVSAAKWYRGDSYKNSVKEISDKLESLRRNMEINSSKRKRNTTLEEYQEYIHGLIEEYYSVVDKLPDIGGARLSRIIDNCTKEGPEKDEYNEGNNIVIVDLGYNVDPKVSMLYNKEELKFELDRFNEIVLE
jgi:hypothetical protein